MNSRFALSAIIMAAFAGPALATDATPNQSIGSVWNGFSLSVSGSNDGVHTRYAVDGGQNPLPFAAHGAPQRPAPLAGATFGGATTNDEGFTGGVEIGFGHAFANGLFAGVAADAYRSTGSGQVVGTVRDLLHLYGTTRVPEFGTVRGRVGAIAFADRLLVFATGGVAWADERTDAGYSYDNSGVDRARSHVGSDWAAGAGVEYMVDRHWALRGEFLDFDLGHRQLLNAVDTSPGGINLAIRQTAKLHLLQGGVTYHF